MNFLHLMHKVGVVLVVTLDLHLLIREMLLVVEVLHRMDNNNLQDQLELVVLVVVVQDIH